MPDGFEYLVESPADRLRERDSHTTGTGLTTAVSERHATAGARIRACWSPYSLMPTYTLLLFCGSLGIVQDVAFQVERLQFSGTGGKKCLRPGKGATVAEYRAGAQRQA